MAADLAAMGAPAAVLARWKAKADPDDAEQDDDDGKPPSGERLFAVRPDNWPCVRLFAALDTQWHHAPLGMAGSMHSGLRYEVLDLVARHLGVRVTPRLFEDIRAMEAAALDELARVRAEREQRRQRERERGRR
ncbi:DUF1799 domain-containing protein [Azospirillum oleiclasticum]